MRAPKVPELFVTALEPSVDDVEQAVHASDVVEEVVVRGVRLQEVVFDRVKQVVDGLERPADIVAASERERCDPSATLRFRARCCCAQRRPIERGEVADRSICGVSDPLATAPGIRSRALSGGGRSRPRCMSRSSGGTARVRVECAA